ncbi:hypothetical protein GCM10010259_57320 [Streptomyces daghestanicus]|uniref:Uncharacterized protein n=1 Tax=Streptomyces daghestanicus TaxID=66885 RepID=A0ABQ3PYJ9_9ACTN|nr:hypothetical protein GCM10010259_57320 [Streptomyces daghestanicus]GHI30089.1 hypothetical protein Sdagh_18190 [Streptomyces daghestanicus]
MFRVRRAPVRAGQGGRAYRVRRGAVRWSLVSVQRRSARRADGGSGGRAGSGAGGADPGTGTADTALDELYATPPPRFVARREELAAEARTAGRAADARLVQQARRPTLAAWAANLLLRSRPEESARLLELGRALRAAYRTLDAAELKSLTAQRRLVTALARQAADLADAAGHPLSAAVRQEVESTLGAVLADEECADRWAAGRLHTALTPPSAFPVGDLAAPPPAPVREGREEGRAARRGKPADRPAVRARHDRAGDELAGDELAARRRARQERLDRARKAAEEAARHRSAARAEAAEADTALDRARERHEEARQRVTEARRRLDEARTEARRADREQRRAEERQRTAAHALTEAEQTAREAERAVRRADPPGR